MAARSTVWPSVAAHGAVLLYMVAQVPRDLDFQVSEGRAQAHCGHSKFEGLMGYDGLLGFWWCAPRDSTKNTARGIFLESIHKDVGDEIT